MACSGNDSDLGKKINNKAKVWRTVFEMWLPKERGAVLLLSLPVADLQLTLTAKVLPGENVVFAESDTEQANTRDRAARSCIEKGCALWSPVIRTLWPRLPWFICQQNRVPNVQAVQRELWIHRSQKGSRQRRCENEPPVPSWLKSEVIPVTPPSSVGL